MKNKFTKLLAMLLVVCMMFSFSSVALAAVADDLTFDCEEYRNEIEELIAEAEEIAKYVEENYEAMYDEAYVYAKENGYIDAALDGIDTAIAAIKQIGDITADEIKEVVGMTDELAEEVAEVIPTLIPTLSEARNLLEKADKLDQEALDALLALLDKAEVTGLKTLDALKQAGIDANEFIVIPALEEANRILVEEVIPYIEENLPIAIEAGAAWLKEQFDEAYAAFLAALPVIDEALYAYFYNNPEEVIAFFVEYGDEISALFAEYGDELFAVLGYIASTLGEDAMDYVLAHPCETLEAFLNWYETYGERTWAMIHVYADALGLCQCENIDEIIAELIACGTEYVEAILEELKAYADEAAAEAIAYIEALIEEIENALETLEEDIREAVEELEEQIAAAIAELQAKLAELIENYEAKLYDATHAIHENCEDGQIYVALGGKVTAGERSSEALYTEIFAEALGEYLEDVVFVDDCTDYDLDINGLAAYIEANEEAIASADIITYNLDAAGILDALLAGEEFVNNWAAYADAEAVEQADMIIAEVNALLAEKYDAELIAFAEELIEAVAYAVVAFGIESYEALEAIREINADATVLAIGMYNPFAGMTVSIDGEVLPIGDYFDYAIEATNLYYTVYAMVTENITFVEADEVALEDVIEIVIEDETDYFAIFNELTDAGDAMVPNAEGHAYISDCILAALTFEGHDFVYIETVDPTYNAQGYDIYECSKCYEIEHRNFTDPLEPADPIVPVDPIVPEKYECDGGEGCHCRKFTDLDPSEWYHYGVDYMIQKGIMIGIGDGKFAPHKAITRAEVAMMLWRLEGTPEASVELTFSDVAADAWYTEAVRWAVESETFLGYGDGTFGPDDVITREQLAAVMFRYADKCDVDVTAEKALADFTDADTVSAWAVDSLEWAYAVEMMIGTGDGKMAPLNDATRATIATVFHRYIENILKLVLEDVVD